MAKKKTGAKTGVKMEKQEHGGSLLRQKAPNHVPGPGRPTSQIREAARKGFDEKIDALIVLAEKAEKDADKIKAIDLLGKYGLGSAKGHDGELVRKLAGVVQATVEDPDIISAIYDGWVNVIGEHIRGSA